MNIYIEYNKVEKVLTTYKVIYGNCKSNLGEILLPEKVKFNGHEKLKFVTYCFEGLRGNNSSILSVFSEKYNLIFNFNF